MKDFILAALPLVALGVAIAVAVTCGLRAKRAATAAMNRNEALSRIGKRVPRVYLQSNAEPVIRMP